MDKTKHSSGASTVGKGVERSRMKAYLVGGGIGSLAAAAFMIRDGGMPGDNISILEAMPVMGGSLDGAGDPAAGYSLRGGRMLTTDNYECTWDLFKSIPSLDHTGKTVFDETVAFNEKYKAHSSLGYQTPAAYAEDISATGSDAVLMEGSAPPPVAQPAPRGVTETAKALIAAG